MKFSIIIPFYNSAKTISKTLNSLVSNKKKEEFELILINDCSNDNSPKIVNKFRAKIKNIKIINNKKNLGVSLSRNIGIKHSNGEYIIFLDSDDYLNIKSLKEIYNLIIYKKYPDVIFGRYKKETFPNNNISIINTCQNKSKIFFLKYILNNKIPLDECWPYIINRKFLKEKKIFFNDLRVAEDQLFVLKLFLNMKNIKFYKNKIFYHHNNFSNTLSDFMDFESGIDCLKVLIEYLKIKKKLKKKISIDLCNFYIQNVLSMFSAILVQSNKKQIEKFTKIASKSISLFRNLVSKREKFNFKKYLNKKILFDYRKEIIKLKLQQIPELEKKSKIYFFCYSKFTGATISFLKLYKNNFKNIIDDNKDLKGKVFLNLKIINSNLLSKKIKKSDICIISNHRDITLKKIYNQLVSFGLTKKQILKFKY